MLLSSLVRQGRVLQALPKVYQNVLTNNSANIFQGIKRVVDKKSVLDCRFITSTVSRRTISGNHAQKWKLEKILTIIMFPVIPATFGNPGTEVLDNLFAVLVTTHAHFGLEAIAKDYVRPILVGPVISKIAVLLVYSLTATTLGSLLYFNHHNIGIGAAGKKIWSIGKTTKEVASV